MNREKFKHQKFKTTWYKLMKIKNIEEEKAYLGIDFCDRGCIWTIWTGLFVPIYGWSYAATKDKQNF